jgi:hypothetical protein
MGANWVFGGTQFSNTMHMEEFIFVVSELLSDLKLIFEHINNEFMSG